MFEITGGVSVYDTASVGVVEPFTATAVAEPGEFAACVGLPRAAAFSERGEEHKAGHVTDAGDFADLSIEDWAWLNDPCRPPDYEVTRAELNLQWAQISASLWAADQGLDEPGAATTAVEQLVAELSGWQLADALRSLPPVAGVDGYTVIELLKGYEKLERFVQAQKVRVLAELGERRYDPREHWSRGAAPVVDDLGHQEQSVADDIFGEISRHAALEVGLALGIPRQQAQNDLLAACTMARRLPRVLVALEEGQISGRAASTLNEHTLELSPELAQLAAERVLDRPAVITVAQTRAAVRAAVLALDPDSARRREQKAVKERSVFFPRSIDDGMGTLCAYLPVADCVATFEQLTRLADASSTPDDPRTPGARRADVLVDLIAGRPILTPDGRDLRGDNPAPVAPPRAWRTDVVVAATTLLGLDDAPGELVGHGPITAQTARYLASTDAGPDPQWRRILTDPLSGIALDYGTTRYRPPDSLADFVRARDGRCYSPICDVPAHRCDIDHILNSPAGPSPRPQADGSTAAHNLAPGCRPDHTTKAAPGWGVQATGTGEYLWTTPTGHTYVRHIEPPLDNGGGPAPGPAPGLTELPKPPELAQSPELARPPAPPEPPELPEPSEPPEPPEPPPF